MHFSNVWLSSHGRVWCFITLDSCQQGSTLCVSHTLRGTGFRTCPSKVRHEIQRLHSYIVLVRRQAGVRTPCLRRTGRTKRSTSRGRAVPWLLAPFTLNASGLHTRARYLLFNLQALVISCLAGTVLHAWPKADCNRAVAHSPRAETRKTHA
jgi:hypothetical protein